MQTMFRTCCVLLLIASGAAAVGLIAAAAQEPPPKIQVLILTGQNNHNWRACTPRIREILQGCGRFEVRVTEEPRGITADTLKYYDVLFDNYNGPRWGETTEQAVLDFVQSGKGFVVLHAANNAFRDWPEFDKLIGGAWRAGAGHGAYHTFVVDIVDGEHPITAGMQAFVHPDEMYHRMTMQPEAHILATAFSSEDHRGTGQDEPMAWVVNYGDGRMFQTLLGHDVRALEDLGCVTLLQRGTEWAATGEVTIPIPDNWPSVPQP